MIRTFFFAFALTFSLVFSARAQVGDSLRVQPNAENSLLDRLSGRWNTTVRSFPSAADTHAVEAKGKSRTYMILDGLFMVQEDSTRFGATLYRDMGLMGYDKGKGKYVLCWIDTHGTGITILTGALNDSGNVVTFQGEREEPKGAKTKLKFVYRSFNGNYRTMEMWETRGSGKARKTMEIQYRRSQ